MMRPFTYVLLLVLVLVCGAGIALADTSVHGITIRTVGDAAPTQLRIGTTTQSQQWSNDGSNETHVVVLQPAVDEGVRSVSFPQAQAAATLLEEEVLFAHDSSELNEESLVAIRTVSTFLMENSDASLDLAGHADATGTEEYNMDLSQRRAEQTRDFFLVNGINADQLVATWLGETQLVVDPLKREPNNRRVEFTLSE